MKASLEINKEQLLADTLAGKFPDARGRFGPFGGRYVPETLVPALDRLQKELGSPKFQVVAISIDRTGLAGARKFLDETNVQNLALYADPSTRLSSVLKAIGLPITVLIDADGREVGRLVGPAEWDSEDAKRLIRAVMK